MDEDNGSAANDAVQDAVLEDAGVVYDEDESPLGPGEEEEAGEWGLAEGGEVEQDAAQEGDDGEGAEFEDWGVEEGEGFDDGLAGVEGLASNLPEDIDTATPAHKLGAQGRPRWMRDLSPSEELVQELMRNRLFAALDGEGASLAGGAQQQPPTGASPAGKSWGGRSPGDYMRSPGTPSDARCFLECFPPTLGPASPFFTREHTFTPAISARSRRIAERNNDPSVSAVDKLTQKPQVEVERWNAKRAELEEEAMKDCTFAPKVDPKSKELMACKAIPEGDRWTLLSAPKRRTEKVDKSSSNEDAARGDRPAWVSLVRRTELMYQPSQEVEDVDCSFTPRINPLPKYLLEQRGNTFGRDKAESEGSATSRAASGKEDAGGGAAAGSATRSLQGGSGGSRHSSLAGGQEQPGASAHGGAGVGPRQSTGRRRFMPQMAPQAPYQHKTGLQAYSKAHHGLTQNVDLGDPVFEDLHHMLHSMRL